MGLQTIRLGLALFHRISGPLAELQIMKSTIERNLWGHLGDTKQTWSAGRWLAMALITQTIPSLATINHQSDSHDGVRGEGWQGWLPTYFKFNFLLRAWMTILAC